MDYPQEFSPRARGQVEAERLKARKDLDQYRNKTQARPRRKHTSGPYGLLWTEEEEDLHEYILRVTRAYGHEGCQIGLLGVWTVDQIRSEVVEFRRQFTIEAHSEKGYDKRGSRLRDMVSNWDGSLLPNIQRTFEESIEWHQFEEELLAVAERQATQNSQPSGPAKSIIEIRDKFLQGAVDYPDLLAHWESREELWTLLRGPEREPADSESVRLFKETVRLAVGLLRKSLTGKPSWHIWLDLLREEKRGFRRIPQFRHWRGGASVEEFMESGAIPSDAILTENGDITNVFSESADFCADMGNLVPDTADSSKGVEPEPGANLIPTHMPESIEKPQDPIPTMEPRAEDTKEERKAVLSWEEVEITFLSDERVQIVASRNTETRNYAEFGFEDGRTKTPNLAWVMLRSLAELNGTIRQAKNGDWAVVEKRMQEIRKVFRKHFKLSGDPLPFVEGTGYQARFKISCAPSFKS